MDTKVTTFLYCLGTTNMDGKGAPLNVMGILPFLSPEFIPSTFSFSIVMGLRGIDETCNHSMSIVFKAPNGEELVEAKNIVIPVEQWMDGDKALPKAYNGLMLGMDLRNVIIRQEGVYWTEVIFDGEKLGDFDIYVKAKPKQ